MSGVAGTLVKFVPQKADTAYNSESSSPRRGCSSQQKHWSDTSGSSSASKRSGRFDNFVLCFSSVSSGSSDEGRSTYFGKGSRNRCSWSGDWRSGSNVSLKEASRLASKKWKPQRRCTLRWGFTNTCRTSSPLPACATHWASGALELANCGSCVGCLAALPEKLTHRAQSPVRKTK